MTKQQALIIKFVLFLAGAGIVLLSFFLINADKELNQNDVFIWISIGVMYLFFFVPFFFSSINIENFSKKIPSISMVWLGNFLYIAASITVIVLLLKAVVSFNMAVIIQAILVFIYLINVYFAYFAVSHAAKTAEDEDDIRYYITKIKSQAAVLLLSVNKLSGEYKETQKILTQTIDDIKYLSPVNGGAGSDLETRILHSLSLLSEILGNINSGAGNFLIGKEAANLQSLVNERKLIRN